MLSESCCVSLMGMAGSGKSTLGKLLAQAMGWAHVDTDLLLEAYYGVCLPELLHSLGLKKFLEAEGRLTASVKLTRTVISTGGSVVYSYEAVHRLRLLGPVVYLHIPKDVFLQRLGDEKQRAFARPSGMSLEDVYDQRAILYERAVDFCLDTASMGPEGSLKCLLELLGR
jgi:shikimate kinase